MSVHYDEQIDINTFLSIMCFPILRVNSTNDKLPIEQRQLPKCVGVIETTYKKRISMYEKAEMLLEDQNIFHKNLAKEYLYK